MRFLYIFSLIKSPVNIGDEKELTMIVKACLGTKFASKWDNLLSDLALRAVQTVYNRNSSHFDCDIKKYAKIEKVSNC